MVYTHFAANFKELKSELNTYKDEIEDIWNMEILPYLEEYFFDQPEKLSEFGWDKVREKIRL